MSRKTDLEKGKLYKTRHISQFARPAHWIESYEFEWMGTVKIGADNVLLFLGTTELPHEHPLSHYQRLHGIEDHTVYVFLWNEQKIFFERDPLKYRQHLLQQVTYSEQIAKNE